MSNRRSPIGEDEIAAARAEALQQIEAGERFRARFKALGSIRTAIEDAKRLGVSSTRPMIEERTQLLWELRDLQHLGFADADETPNEVTRRILLERGHSSYAVAEALGHGRGAVLVDSSQGRATRRAAADRQQQLENLIAIERVGIAKFAELRLAISKLMRTVPEAKREQLARLEALVAIEMSDAISLEAKFVGLLKAMKTSQLRSVTT